MKNNLKIFSAIIIISLFPTLLLWIPFILRLDSFWTIPLPNNGIATIVANYDGPLYIAIAKSLYNSEILKSFPLSLPIEYYPAHFPIYPLLIKSFAWIYNFLYSSLFVTLVSSIFCIFYFYKIVSVNYKNHALWLTFVFSIFPARWLIVRSIPSPEPLFIGSILASLYYFRNKNYWKSSFFGSLAVLTKSPGILLFVSYVLYIFYSLIKEAGQIIKEKKIYTNLTHFFPILFMPVSLGGLFFFYYKMTGNFFAYFHTGDNIHLFFPPLTVFNHTLAWVGTFWLEDIIYIYLFILLGIIKLIKNKEYEFAIFSAVFFLSILFVSHRDIARYASPIGPLIIYSFSDFLIKKEAKIMFILLLIPIYLMSLSFISGNTMPISDWGSFL